MSNDTSLPNKPAFQSSIILSDLQNIKVESLIYYSQRLLLGTSDGRLLLYDTRRSQSGPVVTKSFPHRKKIDQLLVVSHIRTIVVLSDGKISTYGAVDLENIPCDMDSIQTGIKLFCVNQRGPPHYRVCAVLKRKMVLFEFSSDKKMYVFLREFSLNETPESVTWYKNKLFVGYRKQYHIMNDKSGENVPLNMTLDHRTIPYVKFLPNEEILLNALDHLGIFIDHNGNPFPKNSISYSSSPIQIEWSSPYLIAHLPKTGLEIYRHSDQTLIQTISIKNLTAFTGNGMKWDLESRSSNDPEYCVLYATHNPTSIYKLEPLPLDQQVEDLIEKGCLEQAQSLYFTSIEHLSREKQANKLKTFHQMTGLSCLRKMKFKLAFSSFNQSGLDPRELIVFFTEMHSNTFAFQPNILTSSVFPYGSSSSPNIQSSIEYAIKNGIISSSFQLNDVLSDAEKSLMEFLEKARDQQTTVDSRIMESLDYALIVLYLKYGKKKELFVFLKQGQPKFNVEEVKEILFKKGYYMEIGLLYQSIQSYKEALKMYHGLSIGRYQQVGYKDLCKEAVDICLQLKDEDLLWEQLEWMLPLNDEEVLRLLLCKTPCFDSKQVIEKLKVFSDKHQSSFHHISQRYLEGLTNETKGKKYRSSPSLNSSSSSSSTPTIVSKSLLKSYLIHEHEIDSNHTRLALEYLNEVFQLIKSGEKIDVKQPGNEMGKLGNARKRLLKYLKSSHSHYDVKKLIEKLKTNNLLFKEIIICYGRSGEHKEALNMLLKELNDLIGAEEYCLKYGNHQNNEAFYYCIEYCFQQKQNSSLNDFAFHCLGKYAKYMNGVSIINLLPSDTPCYLLMELFSTILPATAFQVRQQMLARNLSNIYCLQMQCKKAQQSSLSIEIDQDTICAACHKRIGDIVFAWYPNGTIVHYKCCNGDLKTCPITGKKFS